MKILTGTQIREADLATMENEPVSSLELMERAAEAMAGEICGMVPQDAHLLIVAGKGNNGGDGLAIARIMSNAGFRCSVLLPYPVREMGEEDRINFERLPEEIDVFTDVAATPWDRYEFIIDALLGSGLKGEVDRHALKVINAVNYQCAKVISIDLPSGMHTEPPNDPANIIRADITLTVQFPKLSMLLPEAGDCCGDIKIVDIDLDSDFIARSDSNYFLVEEELIAGLLKKRLKFSNKGTYGHALVVAGSSDMMGAAILAVNGALRSGCGLVTAHIPEKQSMAIYTSVPSAMVSADKGRFFTSLPQELDKLAVCGIGPGIGQRDETVKALTRLLHAYRKPMVLDADALNILSIHKELFGLVPPGSVLTPHPGEFQRLVGEWDGESRKLQKLRELSRNISSTVVLKGANTAVCLADGRIFFNPTGTAGMAKGGSGDVLTGFITGLMARGYCGEHAALLGVYLHGLGGEKAAEYYGTEAMNSADLPDFIAEAYRELETSKE